MNNVLSPTSARVDHAVLPPGEAGQRRAAQFASILRQTLLSSNRGGETQQAVTLALLALEAGQPSAAPVAGNQGLAPSIARIAQNDMAEYDSPAQARVWSGSTCSAASLTAVARARGMSVRITDVMAAMPGGITPELGLLSRGSLSGAAARLGIATADDVTSYAGLEAATRRGEPVLVDIYSDKFPEGHWLTVTSAGPGGVKVVDSSGYNVQTMETNEFLTAWRGRGMRILPAGDTVQRSTSR